MSAYQKPQQVEARRIVRLINNGLKTQLNEATSCVQKAGAACNSTWELKTLNGTEVLFEDVNSNQWFIANYAVKPEPRLSDIKPVEVIDEEKSFFDACKLLVESIESDNKKAINSAFNRMSLQRFTSKIVPESRQIKCKDGEVHKIPVVESKTFTSEDIAKIVSESKTHYGNGLVLTEGKVTGFNLSNQKPKISPWLPRKVAARSMKQAALTSHTNDLFRSTIIESANLLAEGEIEKAAKKIGKVVQVNEEFTLLTESEMNRVVTNCLATAAIFNDRLASDLSSIAHKLNLKLNKSTILTEWKKIAKSAGSAVLLENVNKLSKALDFQQAHGKFITAVFEAAGGRDTQITMLRTTLEKFANEVGGIKNDPGLSQKMNGLIGKLKSGQVDEATLFEAEDVVAAVGDELRDTDDMSNFDEVGNDMTSLDDELEDASGDDISDLDAVSSAGGSTPVININSPLIQIGGTSGAPKANAGDAAADLGDLGDDMPGDLTDLAGGSDETVEDVDIEGLGETGEAADAAPGDDPLAGGEDDVDLGFGDLEDEPEEEGDGLFESAKNTGSLKISEAVANYGYKYLKEAKLLDRVVESMALSIKSSKTELPLEQIAESAISKLKISIPKKSRWQAIQEAVVAYESANVDEVVEDIEVEESIEDLEQTQTPGVELKESQIFNAHTNKIGPQKTDIVPTLEWTKIGDKSSVGVCEGVKFTLKHDNINSLVIKNDNGSITVPVPKPLTESALGSLNLAKGNPAEFTSWLVRITESIRPISELEEEDLNDEIDDYNPEDSESEDESDEMSPIPNGPEDNMSPIPDGPEDDMASDMSGLEQLGIDPSDELILVAPKSGVVVPVSVDGVDLQDETPDDDFGGEEDDDDDFGGLSDDSDDTDGPDDDSDGPEEDDSEDDDSDGPEEDDDTEDDDSDGPEEDDDDSEDDDDTEDSEDDSDEDSDDKPDFIKESDDKGFMKESGEDEKEDKSSKKPSFIEQKIAERKAKKDGKEPVDRDPKKPIAEGPYDDEGMNTGSSEMSFYYYDNVWLDSRTDTPAAQVIQNIAARSGLTQAIQSGRVQPENCMYNVIVKYSSQDTSDPGDYATPGYASRDVNVIGANVMMEAGSTNIPLTLTPEELQGIEDAYGDDLQNGIRGL